MELAISPAMLAAGAEAVEDCRKRSLGDTEIALAVYLAMEAIREITTLRDEYETVH